MKRLFAVAVIFTSGMLFDLYLRSASPTALASVGGGGAPACSSINGDVNASGEVDLSDAVTILSFLFLGSPTALVPLCETQVPSGLPDTGQRFCYDEAGNTTRVECFSDSCPGQDGSYRTGCPSEGRFVDNGDGTVTDNCTGLMWQQNTADVNFDGQNDGSDRLPWCSALTYCEILGFASHDDWRLPNVLELHTLVDYGKTAPTIDPVFGAEPFFYWSSTSITDGPDGAWAVFFGVGSFDGVRKVGKLSPGHARAVRNAP